MAYRHVRPPFRSATALFLLLVIALAAAGCSGGAAGIRPADREPAGALYQAGHEAMQQGDYAGAARNFRTLEALYPGDANTVQAQLELIYAYHKQDEPALVMVTSDRFIHDYPDHPNLDYVYYLRGLTFFTRATATLGQRESKIRPRPPTADLAVEYFTTLIQRFPDSKYREDARNRILHLRNGLAAFDLATAKIYLSRGDYVNAGIHARGVVENYPDSGVKTEADTIANMAYRMLDLRTGGAAASPAPDGPAIQTGGELSDLAVTSATPPAPAAAPPPEFPSQPEAAAEPPAHPRAALQREDWIARQDPLTYTLQLLSSMDQDALLGFVRSHPLNDLAYFESQREGRPWYSLIHGIFPDTAAARTAAEALPPELRKLRPWIRKLGDIQSLIAAQGAPVAAPR